MVGGRCARFRDYLWDNIWHCVVGSSGLGAVEIDESRDLNQPKTSTGESLLPAIG